MDKIMSVLSIVGAVALGLPALLHAIRLFLKLVPGDPGDALVGKLEDGSQKVADFITKIFPAPKV